MSRFAFVVPPLTGHVNPTVSVANVLASRGHEVMWIGHERVRALLPDGARLHALDGAGGEAWFSPAMDRSKRVRGLESLQLLWQELLVPLARAMLPGVEAAIGALRPDVLIVDQQAIAGALAARRAKLRWASFATTSAGVTDPLADLPKVKAWVDARLASLQEGAGLPVVAGGELSPQLVVVFSTAALVGAQKFPPHYAFVGPSIQARGDATPFPFERLEIGKRRVLVSLGTVSADRGDGFYDTVVDAFAGDPDVQIVLVAPAGAVTRTPPPTMIVRPRVPQLALLPHMHAVVSHGGHNTVCETLAQGLPLVVTPIRDDQPVVARQVVDAGCGVRLRYGRLPPRALRDAVHAVLADAKFREGAARVKASFEAAGGAPRAATLLEGLA